MRKIIFCLLISFLLLVNLVGIVQAKYPEETVTIIVPYAAGGANDIGARLLAPYLQKELGVPVVIENKPGGGGMVGAQYTLSKKPDGYTLLMASWPAMITGILMQNAPYQLSDFDYIGSQQEDPRMLITRPDAPFSTLEEFITFAKENPGEITIGNAGTSSSSWFAAMALEVLANIDIQDIPFGGSAEELAALLGGHTMAGSPTMSYVYAPYEEGKIIILGIMAEKRHPDFPDVPTFIEKGYNLTMSSVRGIVAPKGLPEDVLNTLREAFVNASNNPEFLSKAKEANLLLNIREGKAFEKYSFDQFEIYKTIVEKIKE